MILRGYRFITFVKALKSEKVYNGSKAFMKSPIKNVHEGWLIDLTNKEYSEGVG